MLEPFYTSEIVLARKNPTWQCFDPSSRAADSRTSSFIVRVYARLHDIKESDFKLLIEWTVDMSGLSYAASDLCDITTVSAPNTILFQLKDGVYTYSPEDKSSLVTRQ
jgi:hypothetical protein